MSRRAELASASWTHLREARRRATATVAPALDDERDGALRAARTLLDDARRQGEALDLPARLVDGNATAALAGAVIARQHDLPDLDAAAFLVEVLEGAGGHAPAVIDVLRCERRGTSVSYYRRRTCCLRDRVTDLHRCDTCSLRQPEELDEMVRRSIDRRLDGPA